MKKLKLLIATCLPLIFISGCFKPEPEKTVASFLSAKYNQNYAKSYQYLTEKDKKAMPLDEYLFRDKLSPMAESILHLTTFKIIGTETQDNEATVRVEIEQPDIQRMMAKYFMQALASNVTGDQLDAQVQKDLKARDYPTKKRIKVYELVKEQGAWRVFLDFENEKLKIEEAKKEDEEKKQAQASFYNAIEAADAFRSSKNLKDALKKYQEAIDLITNSETAWFASSKYTAARALREIEEIQNEIEETKEKIAYLPKIALYDLEVKLYKSYVDDFVPGVRFKLKNNGSRALKRVIVTVFFKDQNATIIYEKDYYPVSVSEYSFRDDNKPLNPNYIWQMEDNTYYPADSVPDEWKEGSAEARVSDIEFME